MKWRGLCRQLRSSRVSDLSSPFRVSVEYRSKACDWHRQSQNLKLEPNPAMFDDPGKRIMLYCAAEPIGGAIRSDIAFPHQLEIKVNNQDVRANFRGLKNRPGSTRPADITNL